MKKAAFALGALALAALFLPALTGSALFGFRDMLHNYLPMKALFWQGPSWTWNSFAFGGSSLLADLVQQPFYLPNLLFRLLHVPAVPGIAWFLFLHLLFGMWGAYLLARQVAPGAEGIAAITYGLCGFSLANSGANLQWVCAAAWVPLALFAAARLRESGAARDAALLAIAIPQTLLAGDPLLCGLLFLACAALAKFRRFAVLALGTLLLASPQLYATLRALPLMTRGAGFAMAEREQWSLHPARLAELFVPRLFGPLFENGFWGAFTVSPPWKRSWVHSIYFGVLTPALIFFAAKKREARPWLALAAIALLLSMGPYGGHLYGLLTSLPILKAFRYPERQLALFVPPFSLLLAMGATQLPRKLTPALASAAVSLAALLAVAFFTTPDRGAVMRSVAQIAIAGVAYALALRFSPSPLVLPILLCADLAAANGELLGLLPREPFRNEPAVCASIDRASGNQPRGSFRVFVDQEPLEKSSSDWRVQREREWNFGKRNLLELCGFRESAALTSLDPKAERLLWNRDPLFDLRELGTRYVVTAPGNGARFRGVEVVRTGDFAIVELQAPTLVFGESLGQAARNVVFDGSRIEFDVNQPQPERWMISATLDSDWTPPLQNRGVLRSIEVPAGEQHVVLRHRPIKVLLVFALSLLSLLALALQASRRTPGAAI